MSQRVETQHKQIRLRNLGKLDGAAKRLDILLTRLLSEAGSLSRMLHRSRILNAAKRERILKRDISQMLEASRLTCMARPHIGLEEDRAIAG